MHINTKLRWWSLNIYNPLIVLDTTYFTVALNSCLWELFSVLRRSFMRGTCRHREHGMNVENDTSRMRFVSVN